MSMHASWFPKPVYKTINILAVLLCVGCFSIILITPAGWYILLSILFLWLIFFLAASFTISSGVYLEVICQGPHNNNQIAITFDDGPVNRTTEIFEILKKNKVKATFFFIGKNIEKNRKLVERIHAAGYTIGNHSYTHKAWFPFMRSEKIKNEISSTQKIIQQITGSAPRYFRPPFAITNPSVAKALRSFYLRSIGWSVRSLDTVKHDPEKILNRIKSRLKSGGIVLLHDTSPSVVPVLESLLIYCRQQNFKPVTLEELFQQKMTDE